MNCCRRILLLACLVALSAGQARAREAIRLANSPTLSPDGKILAFEWNGDIWSVPVNGGEAKQLTSHVGRDGQPRFSPNGKELAFVSDRAGDPQVFVMPAAGGVPRQLTYHSGGYTLNGWAPDGQSLLVNASRDHHWRWAERFFTISSKQRGPEKLIFDDYGRDGSLSPDGKKLLFTREGEVWWRKGYHGSRACQVWIYDLQNKTFTRPIESDRDCRYPLWRPDGKAFYYVAAQKGYTALVEYDLETKTGKELYKAVDDLIVQPCISADGSQIVFRQLFDLYRYSPQAREAPRKIDLVHNGDVRTERKEKRTLTTASEAAFTRDGLEIAFIAGGQLYVMDTELREPVHVKMAPAHVRNPVFSPTGDAIYCIYDANGKSDIAVVQKGETARHWFQNTSFKTTRISNAGDVAGPVRFTPDGKSIAYLRDKGNLWLSDANGKNPRQVLKSWNRPDFDFSPDGKWLVYAVHDEDFNRDVWIMPVDGSKKPYNVSRHPNNEFNCVWSPDGRVLAFNGARASTGSDPVISLVYLRAEDLEKTSRDKTLQRALEKINRARQPSRPRQPSSGSDVPSEAATPAQVTQPAQPPRTDLTIDWDDLQDRIRRIPLGSGGNVSALFWAPDGRRLAFTGTYNGQLGTFTIDLNEDTPTPRQLSSGTGSQPRWLRTGNQIVWLSAGVPASLSATAAPTTTPPTTPPTTGRTGRRFTPPTTTPSTTPTETATTAGTPYRFTVVQEVELPRKYASAFNIAWRLMKDGWYDERMGNRDWEAVRKKYVDMAREAPDIETFATVVNMMLGELNGSHLGFAPLGTRRGRGAAPTPQETRGPVEGTAHLGVRFDHTFAGPGLRVRDVLPRSPAAQKRSQIKAGEVILAIDGKNVGPDTDLTAILNGPLARDISLKVKDAQGNERDLVLRPISYIQARSLLYDKWVRDNRQRVEELSKGRLGYLHISAMSMPSFQKFEEELCSAGAGKDGLIIDVRENGGGSTADHLLTALTQPRHAITVGRDGLPGYPQDRKVYTTWNKPIVVLCNQNSYSNAEIFSHAIKTLKRGKLVGVPTAGGVISTGAARVQDLGMLRMPSRGWYTLNDGLDMELNGAVPDVIIWPKPGDLPQGKDEQLAKGVEVLTAEVAEWKKKPLPKLKKATEREANTTAMRD